MKCGPWKHREYITCTLVHSLLNVVWWPCSQSPGTGMVGGRFLLADNTRSVDARSGLEAFCPGEEDGLLSAKNV